ncbi:MAG TPA: PstS family phosphate ABC transporter substrate-binding protein [Vicinamibacterales bacterium]|nr:PstS family phosphate ABC transporter substrate-binding protein [Vicinamibacterales bacterium]
MSYRTLRMRGLLAGAALLAAAACGGGSRTTEGTGDALSGLVSVDGSSTVFPVTEAVAEEFQKAHSGVRVTVGSSGTGGGFQKFCRNETDISDASRPIRGTEVDACAKAGIEFIEIPVAYDGIAVLVNPKNTWVSEMTVAELKRLWEPEAQGKVLRWNQIRPSWPDSEIRLFGPGTDSGTFDYFTEAVTGKERASRGDYTSSEDDNVLVQGIEGDLNALGYFGYAYYEENRDKLKLLAIDDQDETNGSGAIAPSPETVANGTYRPLSRPVFIYVKVGALERPEVLRFVEFYLQNAAELVREVGYIPLKDTEGKLVRERFDQRATGTMFAGTDSHSKLTLEQRLRQ